MSIRTKLSSRASVVCVLVLAGTAIPACSDPTVPALPDTNVTPRDGGGGDAGPRDGGPDTGPRPDTGPLPDTGPQPDTGVMPDAFVDIDTGTPPDDAGTDAFVAPVDDAGTDAFVAPMVDAGMDAFVAPMVDAGTDAFVVPMVDAGRDAFSATDAYMPGCGNNVRDPGEQCDDGDRYNLDGCDSACRYEVVTRITDLDIQRGMAPAMCVHRTNRFGSAVTALAAGPLNTALSDGITAGTTNILIQALGLDDLTGVADPSFTLGVGGASCDPTGATCPRTGNPLDSWYIMNHTGLDAMGHTTSTITAALAARALTTSGNPTVSFPFTLGGSSLLLQMNNVHVIAQISNAAADVPSLPAPPPASIDPTLRVLEVINGAGSSQGICGDITVSSLAAIPVPDILAVGGSNACGCASGSRSYTSCGTGPVTPACNTLLDVFVGGCNADSGIIGCVNAITASQPDVAVTGTPRMLTLTTGNHVTPSQLVGNTDAYSAWFTFMANRVHETGEDCAAATDCQTGQTCNAMMLCQ